MKWQEGDRVWISDRHELGIYIVEIARDGDLIFRCDHPMYWGEWLPIDTPAIPVASRHRGRKQFQSGDKLKDGDEKS